MRPRRPRSDVDGTLIKSKGERSNRLHKQAFRYAHEKVFNVDVSIDVCNHHGCTDPMVSERTLAAVGITPEAAAQGWPQVAAHMIEYVESQSEEEAAVGLDVLPGVPELLAALQQRGAYTGLVTGNLEPIGWAKMRALGLLPLFSAPLFGGFGSDHRERGMLVCIAARRCRELFPDADITEHWHIGDTVRAARSVA